MLKKILITIIALFITTVAAMNLVPGYFVVGCCSKIYHDFDPAPRNQGIICLAVLCEIKEPEYVINAKKTLINILNNLDYQYHTNWEK